MKIVYRCVLYSLLFSYMLVLSTAAVVKLPLYKKELRLKRVSSEQHSSFNKPQGHFQDLTPHVKVISDLQNLAIYTFIDVGTPAQTFQVSLATQNASSDFWVLSVDCTDVGCVNLTKYNHSLSTTYLKNGAPFNDGLASGYLGQDTITIAGLTVVGQVFGEAKIPEDWGVLKDSEGYLCLGLKTSAQTGNPPLFFNLLKQNLIQESVFGIYMAPLNASNNSTSGGLILGGRDSNHYVGELTYTPLTNKESWQFKMNSVSIKYNNTATPAGCQGGCITVIDSLEPFIIGPKKEVDALNKKLGAKNPDPCQDFIDYFDCNSIKTLPTILLNIEGIEFELKPKQYVLDYMNEIICLSLFVGDDVSQWGLGAPFLEAVYTEFDVGKSRLGFAPAKY